MMGSSPFRCQRATQDSFGRSTAMTPSNWIEVHFLIWSCEPAT
jgi:hypothetical protein